MRYLILIIALTLLTTSIKAQSKKKIKGNGIKSKVEWQFEYRNGTEIKFKESEFRFDEGGNLMMEKYFDENGNVIKHIEYQYDNKDRLIVEISYNPKGQIIKKEELKYDGELKAEKRVYGPDGKLKSKKIYEYNQ